MSTVKKGRGFSLVEIIISIGIILMVITPLYSVFSGSRKAVQAARELSVAASLAGSLVSGLRSAPPGALRDFPLTPDLDLPVELSLAVLGVASPPKDYARRVGLRRLSGWGSDRRPLFRLDLEIRWVSPRHKQTLTYTTSSLVRGTANP